MNEDVTGKHRPSNVSGYEGLAIAVIDQARKDFYGCGGRSPRQNQPTEHVDTLRDRLEVVRRRLEAGRFLMESNDKTVRTWFGWTDCNIETFRSRFVGAKERARLQDLMGQEQVLVDRINEVIALKLARNRIKLVKRKPKCATVEAVA